MKVLVLGAGGKTGTLVVEKAMAAGHDVTAFVRRRDAYDGPAKNVATGEATDARTMRAAIEGHEAVIDTIGGKTPYMSTSLERDAARAAIDAMASTGVRRLIVTSMLGVGDSKANSSLLVRLLVETFLRGADKDKSAMEQEVRKSGLDWVIVRPAVLNDGPAKGDVKTF